jgi:uncharacterized protein
MKKQGNAIIYSPTDLIRFPRVAIRSWLDRFHLEDPQAITPTQTARKISCVPFRRRTRAISGASTDRREAGLVEIPKHDFEAARRQTLTALEQRTPVIVQAALASGSFAGYADFLILMPGPLSGWDSKLARSVKPYYAVQLCCYAELLADITGRGDARQDRHHPGNERAGRTSGRGFRPLLPSSEDGIS